MASSIKKPSPLRVQGGVKRVTLALCNGDVGEPNAKRGKAKLKAVTFNDHAPLSQYGKYTASSAEAFKEMQAIVRNKDIFSGKDSEMLNEKLMQLEQLVSEDVGKAIERARKVAFEDVQVAEADLAQELLPEVPIPDFMPICPHPVAPLSLTKAFASAEEDDVVFEQGVISMNDLEEVVKLLECKDLEPML